MSIDPKKPDPADMPSDEEQAETANEGVEKIEEEGEPFDGNFA